jgi:hypothetical protein
MDGPSDAFPELARVADRGESAHHELSKIAETSNDGKASTANRSQQMSYHGVFIRFGKEEWQVATFGVWPWRLAFGVLVAVRNAEIEAWMSRSSSLP